MNRAETAQVLAKIAAFDRRTVGEADVLAWHEVLEDIRLVDALEAVTRYFRDTREWCMPSDIVAHVKALRKARREAVTGFAGQLEANISRIQQLHDMGEIDDALGQVTFRSEVRELVDRVENGEMDAATYRAYKDSGLLLRELDQEQNPERFLTDRSRAQLEYRR